MKKNTSYSKKLQDPRWQKRRLEILQRDNFKCRHCGGGKEELHVHHFDYVKGRDVWDYSDDWLITLCASCHDTIHKSISDNLKVNIKTKDGSDMFFNTTPCEYVGKKLFFYLGEFNVSNLISMLEEDKKIKITDILCLL